MEEYQSYSPHKQHWVSIQTNNSSFLNLSKAWSLISNIWSFRFDNFLRVQVVQGDQSSISSGGPRGSEFNQLRWSKEIRVQSVQAVQGDQSSISSGGPRDQSSISSGGPMDPGFKQSKGSEGEGVKRVKGYRVPRGFWHFRGLINIGNITSWK